jgi:hypothetical protein
MTMAAQATAKTVIIYEASTAKYSFTLPLKVSLILMTAQNAVYFLPLGFLTSGLVFDFGFLFVMAAFSVCRILALSSLVIWSSCLSVICLVLPFLLSQFPPQPETDLQVWTRPEVQPTGRIRFCQLGVDNLRSIISPNINHSGGTLSR